jgi:hypothetical protein
MPKRAFITGLFLLGIITSCKKDSTNTGGVPNVYVNFTAIVGSGGYSNLLNPLGWDYAGFVGYQLNGIILYCQSPGNYLAFDRSCPYDCQTNSKAVIVVLSGNIQAKCPVCGTVYSLIGGGANSGPGTVALKQYYTNYTDSPNLVVTSSP